MRIATFKIRGLALIAILGFAVVIFQAASDFASRSIYDSFDSATEKDLWDMRKIAPDSWTIQSKEVRDGDGALCIWLNQGGGVEKDRTGVCTERAEFMEAKNLYETENEINEFQFSFYIPNDFPITSTRLIIAQWKQKCEVDDCELDNPVLAVRYIDHVFQITSHTEAGKKILFETREELRGSWHDFRAEIIFSRKETGRIRIKIDKKEIVDVTGINAYSVSKDYPDNARFYFKMGLYRDEFPGKMMIFFDEYRKNKLDKISLQSAQAKRP